MLIARRDAAFLLCLALRKMGTAQTVKAGTVILDNGANDVIPVRRQ
jgi:hypothetical protein